MRVLAITPSTRPRASPRPLRLIDLLNDLDELVDMLQSELVHGSPLNAFLLASGISQITEDYLQSDRGLLLKAAEHLGSAGNTVGKVASLAVRSVDSSHRAVRRVWGGDEPAVGWLTGVQSLVSILAPAVLAGERWMEARYATAAGARQLFESHLDLPAALRRSVIRLPSCFRSFDQHPDDMVRLARKYACEFPDRSRPLAVVGVRTSGSYLAPLVAAALEMLGFGDVAWLTMRPGSPLGPAQRKTIGRIKRQGGSALLVDDPPTTGGSLRKTAKGLARHGLRQDAIVLLVALSGGAVEPPEAIKRQRCVVLPWTEWVIQDRLEPDAVREALSGLVEPRRSVEAAERINFDSTGSRGHASARYRVTLFDTQDRTKSVAEVHAGGVGLGYFGEHSLAVARRLGRFSPRIYGFADGILFREWLPSGRRLDPAVGSGDARLTAAVVDYVTARQAALKVPEDRAWRLRGRLPAWEAMSNLLSRAFGRGWAWVRLPIVDPLVKACLRVEAPSVIDGSMAPVHWFAGERSRSMRKIDADRRAFANLDLASYDPVFDLASFAADIELEAGDAHPDRYRQAFEMAGGPAISAERWFLLQTLHLWDRLRLGDGDEPSLRRAMSRVAQRYFAEICLDGGRVPTEGRLVALDVDGVLEGEAIGVSSLTRSSATALRALQGHGFRPVLMTGRSLAEVEDRCRTLNLAGGVAEYGSVVYDHAREQATSLLSDEQSRDVASARAAVARLAGITLDDTYRHSVRAFRFDAEGARRAPEKSILDAALAGAGLRDSIELVAGDSQVDLVAAGTSKGAGLVELARQLGAGADGIALAVGDGPRDVSAFLLARFAVAPAHSPSAVRAAANRTARRPYQAGLADAVRDLIGHRPGECRVCRTDPMDAGRAGLVTLLSAQERGVRSMAGAALKLGLRNMHDLLRRTRVRR